MTDSPVDPKPEPESAFYTDLDRAERAPTGRSCCTIWTLGLILLVTAMIGLWLVFH